MRPKRDRHISGPGEWHWTSPHGKDAPIVPRHQVRTLPEFTPAELAALTLKLGQWLDPDVRAQRQRAWVADTGSTL